jgi:hypothetical protein
VDALISGSPTFNPSAHLRLPLGRQSFGIVTVRLWMHAASPYNLFVTEAHPLQEHGTITCSGSLGISLPRGDHRRNRTFLVIDHPDRLRSTTSRVETRCTEYTDLHCIQALLINALLHEIPVRLLVEETCHNGERDRASVDLLKPLLRSSSVRTYSGTTEAS